MMKVSADVGNSTTKIIFVDGLEKRARRQPTVLSYLATVPQFEDQETDVLVTNLHKNMVIHVTSPGIKRGGLYAVGNIANVLGGDGFNIKSHKKADKDLTLIQPLAMIAVNAVQNAYKTNESVPPSLSIDVEYVSAIPVVDYTKADAKALQDRWLNSHVVTVYVGEGLQTQVTINVNNAKIVQEGIPGFYAILEGPYTMFTEYNKRYEIETDGRYFANRKMLFVDVGDGTVELVSIVDGLPVAIKSTGMRAGVGHASEKAIAAFKYENGLRAEINRQQFMDKVLNLNDKWNSEAAKALEVATYEQEQKIYDAIIEHIETVLLSDVDDIIVFGGGTNNFKELESMLVDYTNQYKMRVLWIDGHSAALLNAIGLDELNNKVFFK